MSYCIVCEEEIDPIEEYGESCYECGEQFHCYDCGSPQTAGYWSSWTPITESFCDLCLDDEEVQTRLRIVRENTEPYVGVGIDRTKRREKIEEDQS